MQKQPKMSLNEERQFQKQVEQWTHEGVVRPLDDLDHSNSGNFNTRFFGVKQRSGKLRFVGDFVHINQLLTDDTNDIPVIDEEFRSLGYHPNAIISQGDLKSAFLQCPVAEEDQHILAFTCKINGQNRRFCFTRIPFGLKQIPSWFHRVIQSILQKGDCNAFYFVDNVWTISDNMKQHAVETRKVLRTLTEVGLVLNPDKCIFGATQLNLLGFIVSGSGVRMDKDRIFDMLNWKRPTTKKNLQKFIGFINYSRRFIKNCSQKLDPFYRLLKVAAFE